MNDLSVGTTRWHRVRHLVPMFAVALVGLALSGVAWLAISQREDQQAELDLQARAKGHALVLQEGINDYVEEIATLRAYFQSSARAIDRREFASFTDHLLHDRPAILALAWIPRVTRDQRTAHELAARAAIPGYRIAAVMPDRKLVTSPEHDEYFPVFYSSHEQPDSRVLGLDLNDGGIRQQTLERARDGDRLATSPNLELFDGVGSNRNGFLVVMPVYAPGQPHETVEDRRRNLIGFVQGVFQTSVMVETILETTTTARGLDLYIYGADSGDGAAPLLFHPSRARAVPADARPRAEVSSGLHWIGELNPGDSRWTFIAAPIPGGPGYTSHGVAWLVLGSVLLVTAVLAAYIYATGYHARYLKSANGRLDAALSNMSQGLCMFDASGTLIMSNDRYRELYGLPPDLVTRGCSIRDLLAYRRQIGQFSGDPDEYIANLQAKIEQRRTSAEIFELPDGRTISVISRPMPAAGWVATHEDITERRRAEAKISHMALHDELTGLPNRRWLLEQIETRLAHPQRDRGFAVFFIDLDRFKNVNDTLGRAACDKCLQQVAARLLGCQRDGDAVARLGGDEFAIVCGDVTEATALTAFAARLIETVTAPFDLDGHQVVVGASIGIALAPTDASDAHQLLKCGDMALSRAKADGRGTYRFFEPKMDALMQARRMLMLDLRKALVNGEFELYYQPLVNLSTGEISGFEALLRWNHAARGVVSPLEFISLAEATTLIVPIGAWVVRQACREAVRWPSNIRVAVNVSPVQFAMSNLAETVTSALAWSGLPASRLELEITESVLLLDKDSTLATLHQLRKMGVRISMDDFGTGYSSLSYLRSFPFDKIKIDRSFVHEASANEDSKAIIRAVIGLGASLGMTTTGEGVETREELDYLKREGCVEAQGYLFSEPRPAAEVAKMLAGRTVKKRSVA
jgi:diguanylate cyclase (GGDEF)-like protein/PAS domain S-box-containing protein